MTGTEPKAAEVIDLGLHRQVRELRQKIEESARQIDELKFQSDEWLAEQTTNVRIVEIRERYGALLEHLRPALLELFVLHISIFAKPGEDRVKFAIDMASAASGILGRTDLFQVLPQLVAEWREKQPAEYRRLLAMYGHETFVRPEAPK